MWSKMAEIGGNGELGLHEDRSGLKTPTTFLVYREKKEKRVVELWVAFFVKKGCSNNRLNGHWAWWSSTEVGIGQVKKNGGWSIVVK